jgi:hypothetical protein
MLLLCLALAAFIPKLKKVGNMLLLCLALGAFLITTYSVQDWGFVDFTLAIVGLICYALAIFFFF